MCGIFGFQFSKQAITKKWITGSKRTLLAATLSLSNDERGKDSWGICALEDNGSLVTKRGLGLFGEAGYHLLNIKNFIGHTRKATVGAKTIANAHPFEIGDIIGAHNGKIHNHNQLDNKYKRKFDVDSMHIFETIDKGLDFKELYGYGAIEWVNKKDPKKFYICKIADRGELAAAQVFFDEKKERLIGTVWSSDIAHLKKALLSSNLVSEEIPIKPGQVYSIEDGVLCIEEMEKKVGGDYQYSGSYFGEDYSGNTTSYYNHNSRSWANKDHIVKTYQPNSDLVSSNGNRLDLYEEDDVTDLNAFKRSQNLLGMTDEQFAKFERLETTESLQVINEERTTK